MCFDGFDLSDGVLRFFRLFSTLRIVSLMYVSPQTETPLTLLDPTLLKLTLKELALLNLNFTNKVTYP